MYLLQSRFQRPHFTLAEIAGVVALVAAALRWPVLILPTLAIVLAFLCDRSGLSLAWTLVVISAVGFVLGIVMGAFAISH
jgi:hypothetical protein